MRSREYEKKSEDFVADETIEAQDVATKDTTTKSVHRPQAYIVTVPNLALRMGPGTNFDKLGIAPSGHVLVDEIKDGFGRLADGSGWICLEYARKVN